MSVAVKHMMNRVVLPNLFFEDELLANTTNGGSPMARLLVAELAPVTGLLVLEDPAPDPHENYGYARSIVIISETTRPDDIPPVLHGVEFLTIDELAASVGQELRNSNDCGTYWTAIPWGWSDPAVQLFQNAGLCCDQPDIEIVRLINSRQFQSQFDEAREINGVGRISCFGNLCHSLSEAESAIRHVCDYSPQGWVIKADLSHACRNRIRGTSPEFSHDNLAWLNSRFSSGEPVYAEPWVQRISECGLQFSITKSLEQPFEIRFMGAAEMLTDEKGRYRGSIIRSLEHQVSSQDSVWKPAIDHGYQIAEAIASRGYFGPLGIDCMIFHETRDHRTWLRLSHDINGRLTMGRVALSLRRWLRPGETGFWMHSSADLCRQNGNRIGEVSCRGVRIIPTSPGRICGRAVKTGTALFVSADVGQLHSIRGRFQDNSC